MGVATDVLTGAASKQYVISTLVICNRGAVGTAYTIALRPNGEALDPKHYIAYQVYLYENDTITITIGITLDAGDVLTFIAETNDVSVSIFGVEITP